MRVPQTLLLLAVIGLHLALPQSTQAQRGTGRALGTLGRALMEHGAEQQRQREMAALLEADQVRAEAYRILAEAQADQALATAELYRALAEGRVGNADERQQTAEAVYVALDETLFEEWKRTPEYGTYEDLYWRTRNLVSPDAASLLWRGASTYWWEWKARRWAEIFPDSSAVLSNVSEAIRAKAVSH